MRTSVFNQFAMSNAPRKVVSKSKQRVRLEFYGRLPDSPNNTGSPVIAISLNSAMTAADGIPLVTYREATLTGLGDVSTFDLEPVIFTKEEHGDLVTRDWYAVHSSANAVNIVVIEVFDMNLSVERS